ncbi:MAG: histidine triad nucleotide-binding protein [Peptococcaceae bacterium]|jgi:histidine triad (HIT) family protein|nr:histidine triad nucleotide-binding protein [Peptococcaceae bacterium]
MSDCIFCQIIAGQIPSVKVYEDERILAFRDVNPAAPVHVLFIPKRHFANLGEMTPADQELLGHLLNVIGREAPGLGLADGYRVVSNCGEPAGQTVGHMHFHVLGGRDLLWPPG